MIKLRKMKWAEHVARMGRGEACTVLGLENLRERDYWRDPGEDGRTVLRWDMGYGLDWAASG
jgi:hypothetical protein